MLDGWNLSGLAATRRNFPKALRRFKAVFHSAARSGGLAPLKTVSVSAKRPAFASAIPSLNVSGIQESSFSTTNLATCARSFAGSALNCSINSVTLTTRTYTDNRCATSLQRSRSLVRPEQSSRSSLWLRPIAQRFFSNRGLRLFDQKIKFARSRIRGHLPVPLVIDVKQPTEQFFPLSHRQRTSRLLDFVDRAHATTIGSAARPAIYFAMQTFFGSVKKRSASSPPSRPTPLCFIPPKGTRRSRTSQQLTQTVPVWICSATR